MTPQNPGFKITVRLERRAESLCQQLRHCTCAGCGRVHNMDGHPVYLDAQVAELVETGLQAARVEGHAVKDNPDRLSMGNGGCHGNISK
jgi:hypothetical protein